jgi:hypothetical protein
VGQLRRGGAGEPLAALLLEALVAGLPADLHHLVLAATAGLRRIHRDLVVALPRIRALARAKRHGAASSRNPSAAAGVEWARTHDSIRFRIGEREGEWCRLGGGFIGGGGRKKM